MKRRSLVPWLVGWLMAAGLALAQGSAPASHGIERLGDRLESLDGTSAMAYFELAEEIAYEEQGARAVGIARQLYVLAYLVDRDSREPRGLGPSVCLGLADLAESHAERRWLFMLADALRGRAAQAGESVADEAQGDLEQTEQLIEAIGHFRAGRFRAVRDVLVRIGVSISRSQGERAKGNSAMEVAGVWTQRRLKLAGVEWSAADQLARALVDSAGVVPCKTCNGSRTVDRRDAEDGSVIGVDLCPTCRGMPAALTIDESLDALALRAQAMLLEAQPTTWSAQHLIDPHGAPTRDLDPDELAPAYGVDPAARFWQPLGLSSNPLEGTWAGEE
jgi:hypothetical protein